MPQAEFSAHEDPHEVVLAARGELDLATAEQLRQNLRAVVASAGDRTIVIDLADVTFLDSTGLEAIVVEMLAIAPRRLTLRRVPDPVRRVLEVTDTIGRFDLEDR